MTNAIRLTLPNAPRWRDNSLSRSYVNVCSTEPEQTDDNKQQKMPLKFWSPVMADKTQTEEKEEEKDELTVAPVLRRKKRKKKKKKNHERASIMQQIEREIENLQSNPQKPREQILKLAEQKYQQSGTALVIDSGNTMDEIMMKQNEQKHKNMALSMTLAMDSHLQSLWYEQDFKTEFSRKFNIPVSHIEIVSVRDSTLIDLKIHAVSRDKNGRYLSLQDIYHAISGKAAEKALASLNIFALEFGALDTGFAATHWTSSYGALRISFMLVCLYVLLMLMMTAMA